MKNKKTVKKHAVKKIKKETSAEASFQGIWSGTISFSLVAIPVRLVRAVEPGRVSFHLLHNKDYSPLKRRMFCPLEEKVVAPADIVRGYEIRPGEHVVITDEELESVSPERSRTIEISEFVDLNAIDPVYYGHPYFLTPLKGGEKSYRLLAEAMQRTGKAGLAKFVLGEREYLVEVKSTDGALELTTLHYSSEVVPDDIASPKDASVDIDEKNSMKSAISGMTAAFKPEKYTDPRRENIMDILRKKTKENAGVLSPETGGEPEEGIQDLMAALEESMRRAKKP
jgi:DNA end-binding protein Ku